MLIMNIPQFVSEMMSFKFGFKDSDRYIAISLLWLKFSNLCSCTDIEYLRCKLACFLFSLQPNDSPTKLRDLLYSNSHLHQDDVSIQSSEDSNLLPKINPFDFSLRWQTLYTVIETPSSEGRNHTTSIYVQFSLIIKNVHFQANHNKRLWSFYWHRLPLIIAWLINYINYNVWDDITYTFPNFNCAARI